MSTPIWEINWELVNSVDDIKDILKSLRLGFKGDLQEFPLVQDKLILKYPENYYEQTN